MFSCNSIRVLSKIVNSINLSVVELPMVKYADIFSMRFYSSFRSRTEKIILKNIFLHCFAFDIRNPIVIMEVGLCLTFALDHLLQQPSWKAFNA